MLTAYKNSQMTRLERFMNSSEFMWRDKVKERVEMCLNTDSSCLDLSFLNITHDNIVKSIAPFINRTPQVKELLINDSGIEDRDVIFLAKNCLLEKIDCHRNNIDVDGIIALAESTSLTCLDISETSFTVNSERRYEAIRALAGSSITELIIKDQYIKEESPLDDKGAKILSKSNSLRVLNIGGNNVTEKGLKYLGENKELTLFFGSESYSSKGGNNNLKNS